MIWESDVGLVTSPPYRTEGIHNDIMDDPQFVPVAQALRSTLAAFFFLSSAFFTASSFCFLRSASFLSFWAAAFWLKEEEAKRNEAFRN